ncbi:MAG: 16S rRNA processing protein RimM [Chloroflexi bacterium]|nr:16S rRNA processing protein RimM [Chloroflexota bacterium]
MTPIEAPRYLAVAKILSTFGTSGLVKAEILTDFPQRFSHLQVVYVGEEHLPFSLKGFRLHGAQVLLQFQGVNTPEEAGKLRGKYIYIPLEKAITLTAGHYYVYQIIGLEVETTAGERLGVIDQVLTTGANDVYVVKGHSHELLIPAIAQVVKEVDLRRGKMIIEPIEGLL